jgi:hypothetical protein
MDYENARAPRPTAHAPFVTFSRRLAALDRAPAPTDAVRAIW